MTARCPTGPRPVLKPGAIYWGDNGRRSCARCAGASALYTGYDLSGQSVDRATLEDAAEWLSEIGRPLGCEAGCTAISTIAGPDGWPLPRQGVR